MGSRKHGSCERDSDVAPHCAKLKPKLRETLSASLAKVCEQATAVRDAHPLPCLRSPPPSSHVFLPNHLRHQFCTCFLPVNSRCSQGLSMLNTRTRPVAPFLALVYGSRSFRQWWITADVSCSQELRMWCAARR